MKTTVPSIQRILLLSTALAIAMTAASTAATTPTSSGLVGRFLQITDIHPDEHYLEGASVSTSCHTILDSADDTADANVRKGRFNYQLNQELEPKEKTLTAQDMSIIRPGLMNINVNGTNVAGRYGMPNTICDSPLALADATLSWIDKNLVGSIDFVVWTGDNARHDSDNTHPRTQEQINQMNDAMAKKFLQAFPRDSDGRRIPIVPSIGNNDIYPHNIMFPGPGAVLNHYALIWAEFIPIEQLESFLVGGYYRSDVIPGKVSVFGLNTLYFYIHNMAVDGCKDKDEPGTKQMDWLENELKYLRELKMVAYLSGHVPPEKKSYSPTCYSRYTKIALKYQDVIVGHLYGHANIDHFFFLTENKKGVAEFVEEEQDDIDQDLSVMEEEEEDDDDDRVLTVMDEEDYDPFHILGLNSYLSTLWKQYKKIPKNINPKNYAVVQVSPSVVPTYQPTLRVFSYQLGNSTVSETQNVVETEKDDSEYEGLMEMNEQDLQEYYTAVSNDDTELVDELEARFKKEHKKPPKSSPLPPVPVNTFGYPLGFTQYWSNITLANENGTPPEFEIEYQTREDYGLKNLGVSEYLTLAKQISKDQVLKKEYLKRMVVQSENVPF
ncbi:Endopolyphosphatase [Entomortierella lignicola]|nr:Endopolyphosphatase [Entomortierella lignicola]